MLRTFQDISIAFLDRAFAADMPAHEDTPQAERKAFIDADPRCQFLLRCKRVYVNAMARAEVYGSVGVGSIEFAENRLVEFQRRAANVFSRSYARQNPQFGLLGRYRPYKCDCCGHIHDVQTNHTGRCFSRCPNCSWRYAKDSYGNGYRDDTQKYRPHYYAGGPVKADERNTYLKGGAA